MRPNRRGHAHRARHRRVGDGTRLRRDQSRRIAVADPRAGAGAHEPALLHQADRRADRRRPVGHPRPAADTRPGMARGARDLRPAPGRARLRHRCEARRLGHGAKARRRRARLRAQERCARMAAQAAALARRRLLPLLGSAALAHGIPRDLPRGRHPPEPGRRGHRAVGHPCGRSRRTPGLGLARRPPRFRRARAHPERRARRGRRAAGRGHRARLAARGDHGRDGDVRFLRHRVERGLHRADRATEPARKHRAGDRRQPHGDLRRRHRDAARLRGAARPLRA